MVLFPSSLPDTEVAEWMRQASSSVRLPSAPRVMLSFAVLCFQGWARLPLPFLSPEQSYHSRGVKNKARPQILQANTQLSKNSLCSRSQGQAGIEDWHGARLALPTRPQQHLGLSNPIPVPFLLFLSLSAPVPVPFKAPLDSSLLLMLRAVRVIPFQYQPVPSGEQHSWGPSAVYYRILAEPGTRV